MMPKIPFRVYSANKGYGTCHALSYGRNFYVIWDQPGIRSGWYRNSIEIVKPEKYRKVDIRIM